MKRRLNNDEEILEEIKRFGQQWAHRVKCLVANNEPEPVGDVPYLMINQYRAECIHCGTVLNLDIYPDGSFRCHADMRLCNKFVVMV